MFVQSSTRFGEIPETAVARSSTKGQNSRTAGSKWKTTQTQRAWKFGFPANSATYFPERSRKQIHPCEPDQFTGVYPQHSRRRVDQENVCRGVLIKKHRLAARTFES